MKSEFLKHINLSNVLNISIFVTLFSYFYLWSYTLLDFNIFIIIIIPISLYIIKKEKLQIKKKNLFYFSLFCFVLIFFFLKQYNFNIGNIPQIKFFKFFGFFSIIIFCILFKNEIIKQIKFLIISFTIIYLLITFYDFLVNLNTFEFNFEGKFSMCSFREGLFRQNIIFSENSHFGMVAVATHAYLLYLCSIETKILKKFLYIFACLVFLFNSSTTYFAGFVFSSIALIACSLKSINKENVIYLLTFLFISIFFLFSDSTCKSRFSDIPIVTDSFSKIHSSVYNDKKNTLLNSDDKKNTLLNFDDKKNTLLNSDDKKNTSFSNEVNLEYANLLKSYWRAQVLLSQLIHDLNSKNNENKKSTIINQIRNQEKKMKKLERNLEDINPEKFKVIKKNMSVNLTTQVFIRSFFISLESIQNEIFGWGQSNYDLAYDKYKFRVPYINPETIYYNIVDGSNNFFKIIVEFGVFGIFLFLFLLKISFDNKVDYNIKVFLLPIIITQLIRGAGYFNGGFLIAVALIVVLHFSRTSVVK